MTKIQKKSLIKSINTTKKANIAASVASPAKNEGGTTRKAIRQRYSRYAQARLGKMDS